MERLPKLERAPLGVGWRERREMPHARLFARILNPDFCWRIDSMVVNTKIRFEDVPVPLLHTWTHLVSEIFTDEGAKCIVFQHADGNSEFVVRYVRGDFVLRLDVVTDPMSTCAHIQGTTLAGRRLFISHFLPEFYVEAAPMIDNIKDELIRCDLVTRGQQVIALDDDGIIYQWKILWDPIKEKKNYVPAKRLRSKVNPLDPRENGCSRLHFKRA